MAAVSDDELEELARRTRDGDVAARDALLAAVYQGVLERCARALPNRLDAEEAAQDTLLAVTRSIGSFDGRSKFTTWLYRVTSNRILDTYRRLKRHQVDPSEIPELEEERRTSVIAGMRVDLLEAMEAVADHYTEPVALRDLCGLDYQEIANELGIPLGTVKSRISEGRRQLKHHMSERS